MAIGGEDEAEFEFEDGQYTYIEDGNGFISVDELGQLMPRWDEEPIDEKVNEAISAVDANGDGSLTGDVE